jgi:hypothetical protein
MQRNLKSEQKFKNINKLEIQKNSKLNKFKFQTKIKNVNKISKSK